MYVPSIPSFVNAYLDQVRYRQTHNNYGSTLSILPCYHLLNLIRYIHLEKPYQREKLFPELAERNRADMEMRMNKI